MSNLLLIDWRRLSFRKNRSVEWNFYFSCLRSDSTFGGGRFRFPLQRSEKHMPFYA
ncbi:Hypothetical protein FKW44_004012, partial [Caligus rogercresseyi]